MFGCIFIQFIKTKRDIASLVKSPDTSLSQIIKVKHEYLVWK